MHYLYLKRQPRVKTIALPHKFLSFFFLFSGFGLIISAAFPIFFYQLFVSPRFQTIIKPVPEEAVLGEKVEEIDYTQIGNWFSEMPRFSPLPSKITHYILSIPKLKINEAVVQIGGEDLKQALVQYEGTALPGQFGNTVIFGHSVLPQFFNPKNYLTIFSTLPTLKVGDEILINFDSVLYRYRIFEMAEVLPSDISVLEQRYDDAYLTLITCVPPGTYLRRLAVKAKLEKI